MTTPPEGLGLYADTPEDRIALFELIRDELTNRVIGVSPGVIPRLALIGTQHVVEDRGSRVVFRGPSGAGKTFLARTLADVLGSLPVLWGLPVLPVNCGLLSEMNFHGQDLASALTTMFDGLRGGHPAQNAELAARAVVVLDDFDHARLSGSYGSRTTRDYREGKQNGLASLLKGEAIPGVERFGASKSWSAQRALVIVNARFDGLPDPAAADDIARWGTLPELAEYLAAAHTFVLAPPAGKELELILHGGVASLRQRFALYGYELHVAPEAVSYLVRAMSDRGTGGGALQARTRLEHAASALLLEALEQRLPVGDIVTLAPYHVLPPPVTRGMWRE